MLLAPFVARKDVLAAAEALIDVFVAHGDFDHPAKGRMKFLVERMGEDGFRAAWQPAFAAARRRPHPRRRRRSTLADDADQAAILAESPGRRVARRRPAAAVARAGRR